MIKFILEFMLLGLIGGLFGIFYRYSLKSQGGIFTSLYYKWLKPWAECTEDIVEAGFKPKAWDKFKAWIARPLGYCIYCSTTWITFFLCALWLFNWESLPDWNLIVIGVLAATGVQHLIVAYACNTSILI